MLRTILVVLSTALLPITACTMKDFTACAIQLSSKNVPFDTNMANVVFSLTSEAKLLHVCRAYSEVIPCFRQRLRICGDDVQQQKYDRAVRLHSFLCSPFSLSRQNTLLRDGDCIVSALEQAKNCTCILDKTIKDYSYCEWNDRKCEEKQQLANEIGCRTAKIKDQCGREAANFYADMYTAINNERLQSRCKYEVRSSPNGGEIHAEIPFKKSEEDNMDSPLESLKDATSTDDNYFATNNVAQAADFYKNLKSKAPLIKSLGDIPILSERNGKLVPNPELSNRFAQLLTEMQKYTAENNDATSANNNSLKSSVDNSPKTVKVRGNAETFTNMFRPSRTNLRKITLTPIHSNLANLKGTEKNNSINSSGNSVNKATNNETAHPLWLHGTRAHMKHEPFWQKTVHTSVIHPVNKDKGVFLDKTKQHNTSTQALSLSNKSNSEHNCTNITEVLSATLPLKLHNDIPEYPAAGMIIKATTPLATTSPSRYIPWYYKSETKKSENEIVNAIVKNITDKFMENRAIIQNGVAHPNYSTGNLAYSQKYDARSFHVLSNANNSQLNVTRQSPSNNLHSTLITRVTVKAPTKLVSVEYDANEAQSISTTSVPIMQTATTTAFTEKFDTQQTSTVPGKVFLPIVTPVVQNHLQSQQLQRHGEPQQQQKQLDNNRKTTLEIVEPQNDHKVVNKFNYAQMANEIITNTGASSLANSMNMLRANSERMDLSELKKVANNYFSTTFEKLKHNAQQFSQSLAEQKNLANGQVGNPSRNPWNHLLSIVAPAVEKVSPGVIQRIKQGISHLTEMNVTNNVNQKVTSV